MGALAGRTRVLVTNQLQFARSADLVAFMQGGALPSGAAFPSPCAPAFPHPRPCFTEGFLPPGCRPCTMRFVVVQLCIWFRAHLQAGVRCPPPPLVQF